MDDLSRKIRSIDWKGLQKQARKVQASTASALKDMVMTDLENKTRAATADTSWGASGSDLMAIAHGTYRREDYALIMSILWQRLASSRRRCVYKALELLKFVIMHGASRCSEEARAALPHLRALTEYMSVDEHGVDQGDGVRKRAVVVCQMLTDEHVLEEERMKSRELRAKLQGGADAPGGRLGGVSSDDYRFQNSNANINNYQANGNDAHSSSAGGTQTFKGYGDDENEDANGNYDDVPQGGFAQRAKQAAAMDDLLGDDNNDEVNGTSSSSNRNNVDDDDEDDESFNPRGAMVAVSDKPSAFGDDDLLADLNNMGLDSSNNNNANKEGSMTTSQLILKLAAEREQNGSNNATQMQVAVVNSHENNGQSNGGGTVFSGAEADNGHNQGEQSDDLFFNQNNNDEQSLSTSTATKSSGQIRALTNNEKDKDPFADLLSNGKEKGIL